MTKEKRSKYITLSKSHGFGSPVVRGTNIQCSILKQMNKAGDSIGLLALLYNLTPEQVKAAIRCKWRSIPSKEVLEYHKQFQASLTVDLGTEK